MFNRSFFKSVSFWFGLFIAYLNRNIFSNVSITDVSWIVDAILFIGAIYLVLSSLIKKQE